MHIAVILATRGRPALLGELLRRLETQTRIPDKIYISATSVDDLPSFGHSGVQVDVIIGSPGLTRQRNRGLIQAEKYADVVVFFDDDFIPSRYWLAYLERFFGDHPEVVGAMGRTVADGAYGPGLSLPEAILLLDAAEPHAPTGDWNPDKCLYGCNMAYRIRALPGHRFDEALPGYGWLEDRDFSYRARKFGAVVRAIDLVGVHLGAKGARASGRRLGFSQVVNPIYLAKVRSIPWVTGIGLALRPFLKNIAMSIRPEYYIDRRGRLVGNILGLAHLASGRCDPGAMERL